VKHLKLYENYFDDASKLASDVDNAREKYGTLCEKEKNMKNLFLKEIGECFEEYAVPGGPLIKFLKIFYFGVEVLYGSKNSGYGCKFNDYGDIKTLSTLSTIYLSKILVALKYKFPEYFEGKDMGFFDLKEK